MKWWSLYLQAICELLVIALVHCDNRLTSGIALGLFASGVAASVLLIAAHDRPFTGQISIDPGPLLQIMPGDAVKRRYLQDGWAPLFHDSQALAGRENEDRVTVDFSVARGCGGACCYGRSTCDP